MKLNYDKNINLKVIDKDNKNENNDQNNEIEIPYYYGTQMSNRVYVSHYLTRLFPFTNMAIEIQGDNFDAPDRLFFSIEKAFKMSSSNKGDLRELIPDFFILPEIFLNINNLNLGQLTNGNLVNNVELPEWGKDPFKFIYKQKKILECNIVSLKLNEWINLVFGYQSRGESAIKKCNVFFPDSYEVNIEKLNKENRIIKLQLCDFGLMPKQLCTSEFEIKQKLNEFKLVCDQESIITRYESSTIEKVENKKLYSFKICEEENRILLIDENYDVMVLKLNIDNMEYKSQNKNSLDNQNSKNKRLLDRFNLFKNKASNLIFLNEPNNINFNRDFNFVGKLKVKDNIKYPIVYFRNPNRYNFMTIIQAGFYFPKILISTVDIYSYNTDHNEDKDFVKAYTENPLILNEHIKDRYVSLNEKIARADAIINSSYYINLEDKNKTKKLHIDSCVKMMLTKISFVDMYTDIERGTKDPILEEYDMLQKCGVLEEIMNRVNSMEASEFNTIIEYVAQDTLANEYEPHEFIKSQVERFGTLVGNVLAPVLSNMNTDDLENVFINKLDDFAPYL
jgi:hypothetical protein